MAAEGAGPLWGIAGYALGTVQILFVEWARRRIDHRTALRSLRAEVRRLSGIDQKFNWPDSGPPTDVLPKPPELTPGFLERMAGVDFYLTDEHHDDNTQQALFELADGCSVLRDSFRGIQQRAARAGHYAHQDPDSLLADMVAASRFYDKTLVRFQISVNSALRDVERRLTEIGWWKQLTRSGRLSAGRNPTRMLPVSAKPPGKS